ncbi:hypothetical protein BDN70DRAFT_826943 [Pholiota conissans]|uniref:Blue (type 1) copper domain-containing protein n=1 Tax=Pholiota conissans TaxID=109636 RepID=A0A9P5Z9U7_9AGAR|nr:hypothetical protein BDN70DRAFT_826943 [Pholiota conissans]
MNIDVAAGGNFVFNPPNITAAVGTLVTFYFPGGSIPHSVTQSSFANPCTFLAADPNNSSSVAGFDSGLVLASTFTINITDTQPIWFHCKQQTHCGSGMVGAINAPSDGNNTYADFVKAAVALGSSAPDVSVRFLSFHGIATALPASDTGAASGGSGSSGSSDASRVVAGAGVALFSAAFAMFILA